MSDLWDYDDDDQDDGGAWQVASPENGKRKATLDPSKGGKRTAKLPATKLELKPVPLPIESSSDDEDDDDFVLLSSPAAGSTRDDLRAKSGAGASDPAARIAPIAQTGRSLNTVTQESLAKEQAMLRALQQVADGDYQPDVDVEPCPVPSVTTLSRLGLSRLAGRLPTALDAQRASGGNENLGLGEGRLAVTADTSALTHAAAHASCGGQELASIGPEGNGPRSVEATATPVEERVQLKLVWGRDKDEFIKLRVVKTDPFSKMIEKFKEIAKERALCRDPQKIKFLFDGDDLAKTPTETPDSMDMEDDMIIDIKL